MDRELAELHRGARDERRRMVPEPDPEAKTEPPREPHPADPHPDDPHEYGPDEHPPADYGEQAAELLQEAADLAAAGDVAAAREAIRNAEHHLGLVRDE